jgi:hypothetical protein
MSHIAAAAQPSNNLPILEPVFNDAWKKSFKPRGVKRDSAFSHLDLQDNEQLLWSSPDSKLKQRPVDEVNF